MQPREARYPNKGGIWIPTRASNPIKRLRSGPILPSDSQQ